MQDKALPGEWFRNDIAFKFLINTYFEKKEKHLQINVLLLIVRFTV